MNKPIHILVVEDSADDAELAVNEFEQVGYDPTWERVETPETMRAALNKKEWDIIISDYSMPHFSGPDALRLIQEQRLDIPFIIVSGTVGEDVAVESMKAGAHDYLLKSSRIRLVPAVERELREAKVREEHRLIEKALQESEDKFRDFVETSTDLVFRLSRTGHIEYISPRIKDLYGGTQ